MPLKIRVGMAVILWLGAMISVILIGARILLFEIADSIGTLWIHTNSLISLVSSLIVCLMELVLTSATDGKSRGGTIVCSCLLLALFTLVFAYDAVGSWFLYASATCLFWNLLLWQASRVRSQRPSVPKQSVTST